ncbi:MAG TPA: hypothetical protein VN541_22930 [Tepidisphaeraceae bacterium]|nr:hypothetical protein [Tepidisphaeraceae bacterium]
MTQLAEPKREVARPSQPPQRSGDERKGRWALVIALILSLIGCGFIEQWAVDWKRTNTGEHPAVAQRGVLSGMDSYALALMLGGLRGPLVMILWSKVENQKMDKDLEDVDTMIEWIRLLQPEFDTVHIFQIWNKAYNISVMMASPASKYTTILDAIDYARRVENDRPDDLNIKDSMARVFSEKLAAKNVTERSFYMQQFRKDSMTDENRKIAYPKDTRYHRLGIRLVNEQNGPILDEHNNLLPSLLQPTFKKPADLSQGSEWNDGSELQYLAPYQPFPYGVSAIAMGYNYAKQAQVAMTVEGQKPLQIGDTVVDSRPALVLKEWADNESDRGVQFEAQAFGLPATAEPHELEIQTAPAITPDAKPSDPHLVDAAIYSYRLSSRLCEDSVREFRRHLGNPQYINPYQNYVSHMEELQAIHAEAAANADYLQALKPGADRNALLSRTAAEYRDALTRYERMVLKYALEGPIADALYRNQRGTLDQAPAQQIDALYQQAIEMVSKLPSSGREYDDLRADYGGYVSRTASRLKQLTAYNQPSVLQVH